MSDPILFKKLPDKEIVTVEKEGKFGEITQKEFNHKIKIENLIKRKTEAKTFKCWLIGSIRVAKEDKNEEMRVLLEEVLSKYNELNPKNTQSIIELEIISGWKGKDDINIYEGFENEFIIIEHRKDKETGEVEQSTHTIPHENVNRILFHIKKFQIGEKRKCYDFANVLNFSTWKDLWKERKIYFAEYYYPIKILEKIGIIKYSGRGDITRLK